MSLIQKIYLKLKSFIGSLYFIPFFTCLMAFSWVIQNEFVACILMALSLCAIFLTQDTVDPLVPILCMFQTFIYKGLGAEVRASHFIAIGIIVPFVIASIVFFFIKTRKKFTGKVKLGKLFVGLIAVLIAVSLGGLGYETLSFGWVAVAFGFVALITMLYILLLNRTSDRFKEWVLYSLLAFGILLLFEVGISILKLDDVQYTLSMKILDIGWATQNAIAIILAFLMPVAFYLSTRSKYPLVYYILGTVFAVVGALMQSRGVSLILLVLYPVTLVVTIIASKKKLVPSIFMGVILALALILFFTTDLAIVTNMFDKFGLGDNGRFRDWRYFYELYETNKAFGIGFFGSGGGLHVGPLNKVHSTIFQIWFCTGIVGSILFAVHYVQRYLLILVKPNKFKLFMLLSLIAFELYGFIDMTLLMYYLMIALFTVFVACEKETSEIDKTKERKKQMENEVLTDGGENVENAVQNLEEQPKKKVKHKLYRYFFKRLFDIILSGLALIILSPVYLVVAIVVRIKHGSPVIFKQPRPGYKNKLFKFRKFRSMTNARDENGALLPDDKRITKFGSFLRKTSLDELPQLWNIFIGDMSIVGPRPKLVQDFVFYSEEQNRRSEVRPGLTGMAQANGRNLNSWAETFKYDLYYVENCSLWLDIKILFKTALKFIKKAEILDTSATPDEYHYGKHLLKNNEITQEEYDQKIIEAKELMTANNFAPDVSTVNQIQTKN